MAGKFRVEGCDCCGEGATVVCCDANVPQIMTLALNGTPSDGSCTGCATLDTTTHTVGWIGDPFCSWTTALEYGGDGGTDDGGGLGGICASSASAAAISETECQIDATFIAGVDDCFATTGSRCVGASYQLVVPLGTDPPWVLDYVPGSSSAGCDFSGTTLTVG